MFEIEDRKRVTKRGRECRNSVLGFFSVFRHTLNVCLLRMLLLHGKSYILYIKFHIHRTSWQFRVSIDDGIVFLRLRLFFKNKGIPIYITVCISEPESELVGTFEYLSSFSIHVTIKLACSGGFMLLQQWRRSSSLITRFCSYTSVIPTTSFCNYQLQALHGCAARYSYHACLTPAPWPWAHMQIQREKLTMLIGAAASRPPPRSSHWQQGCQSGLKTEGS